MSQENVELLRRAYDAWEREGVEGIIPLLDPEVVWRNPAEGVGGVFYGHGGVREWVRQVYEAMEEVHYSVDRIEELPDGRLFALLQARVKGRGSGLEMEIPFAHVIEVHGGKATSLTQYTDIDAALKAVGLRE
jgi:ketosteroid isomerase-like protein